MNLTFNDDGTESFGMREQCQETIDAFLPEKIRSAATTPAMKDLFTVDESSPKLDKERSEIFHSTVMKLAYIAKRVRLDMETTVGGCQRGQKRIGVRSSKEHWSF